MTAISGSTHPATPNPVVLRNYLVYGAAVPDVEGGGFEGWFWVDILGVQSQLPYPPTRVGKVLFPSIELAEAASIAYGLERARGLSREHRV